jgi:hypothetical protein
MGFYPKELNSIYFGWFFFFFIFFKKKKKDIQFQPAKDLCDNMIIA